MFSTALACLLKRSRAPQHEIAAACNMATSTLNNYAKGKREGDETTRRKIASYFNYDYEDMLNMGRILLSGGVVAEMDDTRLPRNTTSAPPLCRAPLISWVQAGDWAEAVEYQEVAQFVYATRPCGPHTFALTIHGDSMEPEFREGDIIVVDPAVQHRNGSFIVAKNGSNEATFKQLVMDGDNVFLKPLNSRYPIKDMTGIEFRIIGVVVQKVKNY